VTTTVQRTLGFDNDNNLTVQNYRQNTSDDETLDTVTTTLTKTLSVRDSANGTQTFGSDLSNTTDGSGVLSEYDDGIYRLANGADRQTYDYTDSTGACYHHRISAAQGWVTADRVTTGC